MAEIFSLIFNDLVIYDLYNDVLFKGDDQGGHCLRYLMKYPLLFQTNSRIYMHNFFGKLDSF